MLHLPLNALPAVRTEPLLQAGVRILTMLTLCRDELHGLLKEEKLVGATLLILANKQDLHGALPAAQIKEVDSTQPAIYYIHIVCVPCLISILGIVG